MAIGILAAEVLPYLWYGNTSAASIPMAMCEAYEEGHLKKGDLMLLDAFGFFLYTSYADQQSRRVGSSWSRRRNKNKQKRRNQPAMRISTTRQMASTMYI
ncbi:hypothetical protein HpBGD84_17240 [Helicobacter pylori]